MFIVHSAWLVAQSDYSVVNTCSGKARFKGIKPLPKSSQLIRVRTRAIPSSSGYWCSVTITLGFKDTVSLYTKF